MASTIKVDTVTTPDGTGNITFSRPIVGDGSNLTNLPAEITKQSTDPTISTNPAGGVGTVFLNTTSGEMFSLTDATAGANVWSSVVPVTYMSGMGGTITTDGDFKVHTFNSSGTFTPALGDAGDGDFVEYLVIAGGGGGGSARAGGGGAGGYRTATGFSVTNTGYTVTIGAGGAGSASNSAKGANGANSVFSTITSTAGGGGGSNSSRPGAAGGSGGGGASTTTVGTKVGGAGNAGSFSPVEGYAGGTGADSITVGAGGGGDGARRSQRGGGAGSALPAVWPPRAHRAGLHAARRPGRGAAGTVCVP